MLCPPHVARLFFPVLITSKLKIIFLSLFLFSFPAQVEAYLEDQMCMDEMWNFFSNLSWKPQLEFVRI